MRQIVAVFLDRERPDSSIAKPAAINITRRPCIKNENEFRINAVSALTEALASPFPNNTIVAIVTAIAAVLIYLFIVVFP